MSPTDGTTTSTASAASRSSWVGPVLALLLLGAEYLWVSHHFDAEPLRRASGSLRWLGDLGVLGPLAAVGLTVLWLLQGGRLPTLLQQRSEARGLGRVALCLGVNGLSFLAFVQVTAKIFASGTQLHGPTAEPVSPAWPWVVIWFGLLALLVGSAAVAAVPLRWRWLVRPRALVGVAVMAGFALLAWFSGVQSTQLWSRFGGTTVQLVGAMVASAYPDPIINVEDSILGTSRFYVGIAPVCSGFESMGLITVLLSGYLVAFRRRFRFPHAMLLVPLGVALAWALNNVRLFALIALGTSLSPELALGAFHSKAGWLLFCLVAVGMAMLAHRPVFLSALGREERSAPSERVTENPAAPYLVPLLVLLAVALLSGLWFDAPDPLYGLRCLGAGVALWAFRRAYVPHVGGVGWLGFAAGAALVPVWLLLVPAANPEAVQGFAERLASMTTGQRWAWLVVRAAGSVLIVPVVEELAFRGYLLRRLIASEFEQVSFERFRLAAVMISSIAFGILHDAWVAGTLAGLVYAGVQLRTRNLREAIVAHATTNAGVAAYVLITNDWAHWL